MAVGAQESDVLRTGVVRIPIDVIDMERDRIIAPLIPEAASLALVRAAGLDEGAAE
ncbi:hypothetical protein YT1_2200 [Rhodococcus ruber]|nr:hypothetical protein YT1_2200 [Rhodococcus ruber]